MRYPRGVPSAKSSRVFDIENPSSFNVLYYIELPMDLRGIATIEGTKKIIAGGMIADQLVTDQTLLLEWNADVVKAKDIVEGRTIQVRPNPAAKYISFSLESMKNNKSYNYHLYDVNGVEIRTNYINSKNVEICISDLPNGPYLLVFSSENEILETEQIIIQH